MLQPLTNGVILRTSVISILKRICFLSSVASMLQRMGALRNGSEPIGTVRASTGERAVATVRKRTWRNSKGEQTAWVADYFDQHGSRRIKTFAKKKEADAFLVTTQGEVARGVHTPESASITVAEACEIWIERGELEKLERTTLKQYRSCGPAHQAVPDRPRETRPAVDADNRSVSRRLAEEILAANGA